MREFHGTITHTKHPEHHEKERERVIKNFLPCCFAFFLTFLVTSRIKSISKTLLTDKLRKKKVRERGKKRREWREK